jgi:nucleoside-diphosphate-sugar epimerase
MKKVLVTGASGFVGRAVASTLSRHGFEVHVCSSKPGLSSSFSFHEANLLNPEMVYELFARVKPTYLVQLAWCTGHGSYWKDVANLDWLCANTHIARAFTANGGEYALFAGTSAEYGWDTLAPLDEGAPLLPSSLYGGAKLGSYNSLSAYFSQVGLRFGWARLFNPFGENEDPRRLIPKICRKLIHGEHVHFDAGLEQRDFLHIDDLAEAFHSVMMHKIQGAVNIGSGEPVSIRDAVMSIASAAGRKDLVHFSDEGKERMSSIIVANIDKLKIETGWKPAHTFDNRILQTYSWWEKQEKNK